MPTITIRASEMPVPQRRAVALRLTRWLTGEGVCASHVVVRFEAAAPNTVFAGGLPVEALDGGHGELAHASVTCRVSSDRDQTFRSRLVAEIAAALPAGTQMPFLYVEFEPTAPADVWIGQHGNLMRADRAASPTPVAALRSLNDRDRSVQP